MASNKSRNSSKTNSVEFSNLSAPVESLLLISPRLSKEEMNKSKFHDKNKGKNILQYFYAQAFLDSIKEILKIKESFP